MFPMRPEVQMATQPRTWCNSADSQPGSLESINEFRPGPPSLQNHKALTKGEHLDLGSSPKMNEGKQLTLRTGKRENRPESDHGKSEPHTCEHCTCYEKKSPILPSRHRSVDPPEKRDRCKLPPCSSLTMGPLPHNQHLFRSPQNPYPS